MIFARMCKWEAQVGIHRLDSGKWRLQVRRKSLNVDEVFDTKDEASARLEQLEAVTKVKNGADATLRQIWEIYKLSSEFSEKKAKTQSTELGRIVPVLKELGGYSLRTLQENTGLIYAYRDTRLRTKSTRTKRVLSKTSVRLEMAALSAVVAFAKERQMIPANFVSYISRPAPEKRRRRVPLKEQGGLQLAAHAHGAPTEVPARFALLMRFLGCRPGELKELRKDDVNLRQQDLLFRDTKNGTDRRVHAVDQARGLLAAQMRYHQENTPDSPFLFTTWGKDKTWKPYNYANGVNILRQHKVVKADYHAHAMRREYISRAIEAGLEYATIRKQTGHKSTQAIEIYDEGLSTSEDQRAIHEAHAAVLKREQLLGAIEAIGVKPEDLDKVMAALEKRAPDSEWIVPFPDKVKE